MNKSMGCTKQVNQKFSEELIEAMDDLCARLCINRSSLTRLAIAEYIQNHGGIIKN